MLIMAKIKAMKRSSVLCWQEIQVKKRLTLYRSTSSLYPFIASVA
jgi:hypothetical protein